MSSCFHLGCRIADHRVAIEVHVEGGLSVEEAVGASGMNGDVLSVPVGVEIPFGHASIGMGPDDFVLTIDGFSGELRPAQEELPTCLPK